MGGRPFDMVNSLDISQATLLGMYTVVSIEGGGTYHLLGDGMNSLAFSRTLQEQAVVEQTIVKGEPLRLRYRASGETFSTEKPVLRIRFFREPLVLHISVVPGMRDMVEDLLRLVAKDFPRSQIKVTAL